MPTKPPQIALGYFVRFMVAYGNAGPDVRAQLSVEEYDWAQGRMDDRQYVQTVSRLLGIEPPPVIT